MYDSTSFSTLPLKPSLSAGSRLLSSKKAKSMIFKSNLNVDTIDDNPTNRKKFVRGHRKTKSDMHFSKNMLDGSNKAYNNLSSTSFSSIPADNTILEHSIIKRPQTWSKKALKLITDIGSFSSENTIQSIAPSNNSSNSSFLPNWMIRSNRKNSIEMDRDELADSASPISGKDADFQKLFVFPESEYLVACN